MVDPVFGYRELEIVCVLCCRRASVLSLPSSRWISGQFERAVAQVPRLHSRLTNGTGGTLDLLDLPWKVRKSLAWRCHVRA